MTEQSALDATLSVDQLTEALQGTISSDAKVSLGPLTISLAPFIYLIGRVLSPHVLPVACTATAIGSSSPRRWCATARLAGACSAIFH